MSDRKHPNVVNLRDVQPMVREMGERFGFTARWLGPQAGAQALGCAWYEQAPGRTAFPRHFHTTNEEALFVLEGQGEVTIGDRVVPVEAGDFVSFPVGPEHAHSTKNAGSGPLRYLCFSTAKTVDVVGYPDSGKLMARALPPGARFGDTPWLGGIFKQDSSVGYYDGEDLEATDAPAPAAPEESE